MRSLISGSLKLRFMVLAAAIALFVVGFVNLRHTPTNLLPEFSPPIVEIQTEALGLSAAEVEQLITVPLEADLLNGVAWLESIRSQSIPSLSSVELQFAPGTDLLAARHMVQEKMTQAAGLPNVSKPPVMLQPVSSTSRVLHVGLSSPELSVMQMSVLARWNIRPRLMGVPGVANVSIWGQRNRQLQVLVDPERIRAAGISLRDIISTTGNALWVSPLSFLDASTPGTGGFIDGPNQRLGVRHVLPIVSPEGLADVVIENSNKRLGDVTQVVESHQPLIGDAIIGGGTGLMLVVQKFPWADTLDVTRGVERALAEMRPGLKGIQIDTQIFRPANFIEQAVTNLRLALLAAGALVVLGLFLLFFDLRVALISFTAIVSSLLLAWFVMFLRGTTLNAFIFTGLAMAIGAIVDDGIVEVQNIRWRLGQPRPEGMTKRDVIVAAASEVRGPLGFATLMLLLVVLPLVFLEGVFGSFMVSVAAGYALAVLASFVVALTLTPALSLMLLPDVSREVRGSPFGRSFAARYAGVMPRLFRAKLPAGVIAGIGVIAAAVSFPLLEQQDLLPEFHETDQLIHWDAKPGTSRPEMTRITTRVAHELRAIPGVRSVGGHIGRAVNSDQIVGVNSGELWINIDPKADYKATLRTINGVLDSYPGMESEVSTYTAERIAKIRGVDKGEVVVRIYGQDSDVLAAEAKKIKSMCSDYDCRLAAQQHQTGEGLSVRYRTFKH